MSPPDEPAQPFTAKNWPFLALLVVIAGAAAGIPAVSGDWAAARLVLDAVGAVLVLVVLALWIPSLLRRRK